MHGRHRNRALGPELERQPAPGHQAIGSRRLRSADQGNEEFLPERKNTPQGRAATERSRRAPLRGNGCQPLANGVPSAGNPTLGTSRNDRRPRDSHPCRNLALAFSFILIFSHSSEWRPAFWRSHSSAGAGPLDRRWWMTFRPQWQADSWWHALRSSAPDSRFGSGLTLRTEGSPSTGESATCACPVSADRAVPASRPRLPAPASRRPVTLAQVVCAADSPSLRKLPPSLSGRVLP